MIGYVMNPRFGAWTYNLIRHKGLSVALYVLGYLTAIPWLMFAALRAILLGHSSLDRVLGCGLKRRLPEHAAGEDWKTECLLNFSNPKLGARSLTMSF